MLVTKIVLSLHSKIKIMSISITKPTLEGAIQIWKELGIEKCIMEFSCGGDSMNDYNFKFFDNKDKEVENQELYNYFEDEVFNKVTFYEASDGHYQGEFGKVIIGLDEEDEEPHFIYDKQAESQWSENYTDVLPVKLTKKEAEFIRKNVLGIGGSFDEDTNFVYKKDLFLTDEDEKIIDSIGKKVYDVAANFEPDAEGDPEDWFSYTTNLTDDSFNDAEITFEGNNLHIRVSRSVLEVRQD